MEAAFAWVQQLWTFLVSLIPHLLIVRATHGGVKYVHGHTVEELRPGLRWYWPIVTEVEVVPTLPQPLRLTHQVLLTGDNKSVHVSGLMLYRVTDVVAYCTGLWDADATIDDLCAAALRQVVTTKSLQELQVNTRRTVDSALERECSRLVAQYGVEIEYVRFADFAPCRVLALVHQSQQPQTHAVMQGS